MENERNVNGHADLRLAIVQMNERVEGLHSKFDEMRPCLITRRDCDKRHLDVVDRRYFLGFVAAIGLFAAYLKFWP